MARAALPLLDGSAAAAGPGRTPSDRPVCIRRNSPYSEIQPWSGVDPDQVRRGRASYLSDIHALPLIRKRR